MSAPAYYSADMVRALPDDGNRYETVHGELLVTPSPRLLHQLVLERLAAALSAYLQREQIGVILRSPADISWGQDTLVQPDLFVVPTDEARALDWRRIEHLLLVAEVLSPGTARYDRFTKRRLYQEAQVPTYWIVDPEAAQAELWTPNAPFPTVERDVLQWHPAGAEAPFRLSLEVLLKPL